MTKNKKILFIVGSIVMIVIISIGFAITMDAMYSKREPINQKIAMCPTGFIAVPGNINYRTNDFCVMKYEAKDLNGVANSNAKSDPWVGVSQVVAVDLAKNSCNGCHLITENEWLTIAQNVISVSDNWSGGETGKGFIYSGHNDNSPAIALAVYNNDGYNGTENSKDSSQKRTLRLTNGEIIWDMSGNVAEWTDGQTTGGQPGTGSETAYSWKEWNLIDFSGYLPVSPFPGFNNNAAGGWDAKQGIGQVYSNANEATLKGFIRGGSYQQGPSAGIFSLNMGNVPMYSSPFVGFRVAR